MRHREEISNLRSTVKREAFASQWDLSSIEPTLFKTALALDIIITRLSDPAHSEYRGICEQLHTLLSETKFLLRELLVFGSLVKRFIPKSTELQR